MYSKESYRSLVSLALQRGYRFVSFLDKGNDGGRRIYLRHDVDYSLRMAVELAEVNHSMGVHGTFCLLLRSQVYNLLSDWAIEYAGKIRGLGQHLAFHCTVPSTVPASDQELARQVLTDFETVRRYLPEVEPAFSWHNPTPGLVERGQHFEVPGLLNLYGPRFVKDIAYYSDSNMRYSATRFEEIIGQNDDAALHLLFHPFNWIGGGSTMLEVFAATWKYIIREREQEIKLNHSYFEALPEGMPETVLQGFADQWSKACGAALTGER